MTEEYKSFVRCFKKKMAEKDLNIRETAEAMGISKSVIYGWISYKHVMSGEDMLKVIDKVMDGKLVIEKGVK